MGNEQKKMAKLHSELKQRIEKYDTRMDKITEEMENLDSKIASNFYAKINNLDAQEKFALSEVSDAFNADRKRLGVTETAKQLQGNHLRSSIYLVKKFSNQDHPKMIPALISAKIWKGLESTSLSFHSDSMALGYTRLCPAPQEISVAPNQKPISWISTGFPTVRRDLKTLNNTGVGTKVMDCYAICVHPQTGEVYATRSGTGITRYTADLEEIASYKAPEGKKLRDPRGIDISLDGIVAVASNGDSSIHYLTSDLKLIRVVGNTPKKEQNFYYPQGVSFDVEGNLFVCDGANRRIVKLDKEGKFLMAFDVSRAQEMDSLCSWPWGIVVTNRMDVIVSPQAQDLLYVYDLNGVNKRSFNFPQATNCDLITRGPDDGFVYTSHSQKKILFFDNQDTLIHEIALPSVYSAAFGLDGRLYICHSSPKVISIF
eukprot:TRINITY_DN4894_c0_g2_i1.p1 TRINITY_DN4894_c0_g2~~TRINITY_DN4894_c0_g2_i1.p1  ORF type:complete len:429 (-),score=79.48 TRINITY_DN4894_c0_g2_i1:198-1484(-)